jgi:hypothetical protein
MTGAGSFEINPLTKETHEDPIWMEFVLAEPKATSRVGDGPPTRLTLAMRPNTPHPQQLRT